MKKYPIKLAFDYAWENLARSQYCDRDMNFPKEKCKDFLKEQFGIDSSNGNFKLYAGLLFITENIATLEYGEPNDKAKIISKIKERIKEFDPNKNLAELQEAKELKEKIKKLEKWKKKKEIQKVREKNKPLYDRFEKIKHLITMEKYFPEIEKAIKDYLNKSKTEREKIRKEKTDETYLAFLKAKQKIGLVRGEQKNKIKKYSELTQTFKDLASNFGKKFAELRDKFREENEINKISYCGIIVEDKNCDRYLLLQPIQPINDNNNKSNCNDTQIYETKRGELTTYQVKSLTSKTLNKMIKNTGSYKEFHYCSCEENKIGEKEYKKCCGIDSKKVKEEWAAYQNEDTFISALEKALTNSIMAKSQKWAEFNWNLNRDKYDEIAKEVDIKSYILQRGKISVEKVTDLIKNNNCLLLPIVNQDITSETRKNKNQFSKDWKMIFDDTIKEYRLHPEFNIIYRKPVPDYPKPKEPNRYSRFQMIANIQCEIMPQMSQTSVKTKKEQIEKFNNKESQKKTVKNFNDKVKENIGNDFNVFYVFGIDRGIKQLATLCILDNKGIIQGDFKIYKREFDKYKKQWIHSQIRTDNILDLSNIRVETTIEGKKVLVDLSKILVHDKNNPGENKKNQQTIKLKQLAYIRKLQYQMQYNSEKVKNFINSFEMTKNESGRNEFKNFETKIIEKIKESELISPYKQGPKYSDLPIEKFKQMLENFKYYDDNKLDKEKQKLCELDVADKLKSGIVANMVGVIVYLLELDKYRNKTYISLENLNRAYHFSKDGITGQTIPSTYQDPEVDFKEQENLVLAGVGTYQFFEIQLLKKLFKIQRENKIVNLVPAFRSVANYEQIIERNKESDKDEYKNYPFGIVQFVDPKNTSKKCPWCGATKEFSRVSKDFIKCQNCNFSTIENKKHDIDNKQNKEGLNLHFIENGDQNGAYHIALKTLKNIKKQNK